jgi:hypothetical protein
MFHIGQLVVCVDAGPVGTYFPTLGIDFNMRVILEKGAIYTVRGYAEECPFGDNRGQYLAPGVWLEEVIRDDGDCGTLDQPFGAKRFRAVEKQKIEIFTKMLEPVDA